MSSYQINAIVTRALLDPGFKDAILNGQRCQKLQEFDLPEELVNAILQMGGDDIHQFIYQLNDLMAAHRFPIQYTLWNSMPVHEHFKHV